MDTIQDGEASTSTTSSLSRYDRFVERFLQDDGTICLILILVIVAIRHLIIHIKQRMSVGSPESSNGSSSSSGLSSTSTKSSGLSSLDSSERSKMPKSILKKAKSPKPKSSSSSSPLSSSSSGVPLRRFFVYILIVSIIGFLWGQQFSDHAETRAMVGAIASFIGQQLNTNTETSNPKELLSDDDTLQRYIQEQNQKRIALPTFADPSHAETVLSQARQASRRKRFAEFLIHPILLATGEPAMSVAIAVNTNPRESIDPSIHGIDLAKDLVREILLYKDVDQIAVFLVSQDAALKEKKKCPFGLQKLADETPTVDIECNHVHPAWRHHFEEYLDNTLIEMDTFDVSIVLSGCNALDLKDRLWEEKLYESTNSIMSTCSGPLRPPGRSITSIGQAKQYHRFHVISEFFEKDEADNSTEAMDLDDHVDHVIDYDILGLNMAVALHSHVYRWHFNEANYNTNLLMRMKENAPETLVFFDAPDMTRLEYASRQSAESYCAYLKDQGADEDDLYYCIQGIDPNLENIPLDKIYVGKSGAGENAGRGVFTSVDILEYKTYIGMETNVFPVHYPPLSKAIVEEVMDMKIYENVDDPMEDDDDDDDDDEEDDYDGWGINTHPGESKLMTHRLHRAPSTYAEAYGFTDEPWGIGQASVYSNILTFVNHGCNGTANIGVNVPGLNEFTMDVTSPDFKMPDVFEQFTRGYYTPHRDRFYMGSLISTQVMHPPVLAGQELFDNYIEFGGMEHFKVNVRELKRDCSGAMGTVETQQHYLKKKAKLGTENPPSNLKSQSAEDIDVEEKISDDHEEDHYEGSIEEDVSDDGNSDDGDDDDDEIVEKTSETTSDEL